MGEFFHSKRFRILLAVFSLITAFMFHALATQGITPIASRVAGIIVKPITSISSSISSSVQEFLEPFLHASQIARENEELKNEINELNQKLVEFENYKFENETYREYLEIKEQNPDYTFEPAKVIGRNADNRFASFTIDVGSFQGVSLYDPVITSEGLIGIIAEVSYSNSIVNTVIDPTVYVGVRDIRTMDVGTISGSSLYFSEGFTKLSNIPKDSSILVGDYLVTTGISGTFPSGLIVGTVMEIGTESDGLSTYAKVKPVTDLDAVNSVFVLKDFNVE